MSLLYQNAAGAIGEDTSTTKEETDPVRNRHLRLHVRPDMGGARQVGNPITARVVGRPPVDRNDARDGGVVHPRARVTRLALGAVTPSRPDILESLLRRLPVRAHHVAVDVCSWRAARVDVLASGGGIAGAAVPSRLCELGSQRAPVRRRSVAALEPGVRAPLTQTILEGASA